MSGPAGKHDETFRTMYRVERWWGRWAVVDYPPSNGSEVLRRPLSMHRWQWLAWREAQRLAKANYGDAVLEISWYRQDE